MVSSGKLTKQSYTQNMRTLERTEQYAQEGVICQRVAGVLSCSNSLNAFSFVMHRNDNRKCIPLSQKSHCGVRGGAVANSGRRQASEHLLIGWRFGRRLARLIRHRDSISACRRTTNREYLLINNTVLEVLGLYLRVSPVSTQFTTATLNETTPAESPPS